MTDSRESGLILVAILWNWLIITVHFIISVNLYHFYVFVSFFVMT